MIWLKPMNCKIAHRESTKCWDPGIEDPEEGFKKCWRFKPKGLMCQPQSGRLMYLDVDPRKTHYVDSDHTGWQYIEIYRMSWTKFWVQNFWGTQLLGGQLIFGEQNCFRVKKCPNFLRGFKNLRGKKFVVVNELESKQWS